jgi:CxxC motif-containing protein (DUF1111 family)
MKQIKVVCLIILLVITAAACEKLLPKAPADDQLLDGPLKGLTAQELKEFTMGDAAFNNQIFTAETGLGPLFVATSCGTCHAGDGKGHPFSTLTRFGQTDSTGNHFLQLGGPQLQNHSIINYTAEEIPAGATFSNFTPPANTGLGFLDAVTDEDILSLSDPGDGNGDGISGRPNWIIPPPYITKRPGTISFNGKFIARFGKKAAAYDLHHQTVNAYNQDMGIASSYDPHNTYSHLVVDPEISNQTIIDVVLYLKTLKAPIQRNSSDESVTEGKKIFNNIQCGSCHVPTLKTGKSGISALSNKSFSPYTDLLLHDMGSSLDDGYTEGSATTAEWRTPPLWGLGLSKNSQGGRYFLLHDGRAGSIEEAIRLHGGEAERSKNNFEELSAIEKTKLIRFLESL